MQWVIDNWILLALGGGMVAMHLFGHGGHGGHGKSRRHDQDDATGRRPKSKPDPKNSAAVIPKVGPEKSTKAASNNSKIKEKSDDH